MPLFDFPRLFLNTSSTSATRVTKEAPAQDAARLREKARIIRVRAEQIDGPAYYAEIARAQRMLIDAWRMEGML